MQAVIPPVPAPWQQAWPEPPQVVQIAGVAAPGGLEQPRPALQTAPGQQPCPSAPHASQRIAPPSTAWQEFPAVHEFAPPPAVQHGWPAEPHASQVPIAQRAPGAVQVPPTPASLVPQHACVAAPQSAVPFWHEPLMHMPEVPPPVQVAPPAMHMLPTQQPPLLQVLAAQQA
jgi:hypothetical protein